MGYVVKIEHLPGSDATEPFLQGDWAGGEMDDIGDLRGVVFADEASADAACRYMRNTGHRNIYTVATLASVIGPEVQGPPTRDQIDPYRLIEGVPLELEDGTPVTGTPNGASHVRVHGTRDGDGFYPYLSPGCGWSHETWSGRFAGDDTGQYLRVRRADLGLPPISVAKLKARQEVNKLPPELQVPWSGAEWQKADHFAVLTLDGKNVMVSFYDNEKHIDAGRRTQMRVGRYLTRHYGDTLSANEVERLASEASVKAGAAGLTVTQDADEIEEVYVNGPNSCMSDDDWDSGVHPARVYAGPDLAVAYTGSRDNPSGRAVVWPEKKVYYSIYGDCSRMEMLLAAEGYRQSGSEMKGARGRLIRHPDYDDRIVIPYVDFTSYAEADDCAGVLIFGRGDLEAQDTSGWVHCSGSAYCSRCDCREPADDFQEVDGEDVCGSCASDSTYCDLGDYRTFNDTVGVHSSDERWELTMEVGCEDDHDVVVVTSGSRDGEYWMRGDTFICDDCGEVFHKDDRVAHGCEDLCSPCLEDRGPDDGVTVVDTSLAIAA